MPRRRRSPPGDAVAPRGLPTQSHSTWFSVFTWVRNIGIIVLLFVAWQLWGTAIAQHQAQDQLKSQFDAAMKSHHPPPEAKTVAGTTLIPASTNFPSPADGSVVARLQIPSIGVDQYVVSGTTDDDLSKGPGHYAGTALPGQAGNVAIAGHRTTHGAPFNGLGRLVHGDRIILTTTWGEHLDLCGHRAAGGRLAERRLRAQLLRRQPDHPHDLQPGVLIDAAPGGRGRAPDDGPHEQKPAKAITYHLVDPSTASWDWSLLPAVGVEVCLLLLLGLSYRRTDFWFGRVGKWFIIVPVWAAMLYLLFGTLTSFLPSSI